MKMPTTLASGRSRTRAKAPARKTTLNRSLKTRTASARSKASATTRANSKPKAKAKSKTAAQSKAAPKAKAAPKTKAKSASAARSKSAGKQVAGAAKTTTNHAKIQQWAESRRGTPSTVKSTRSKNGAGVLRIDFPGFRGAGTLQKISWDEWFETFDENRLAFLYQDKTKDGKQSRFFKLVKK